MKRLILIPILLWHSAWAYSSLVIGPRVSGVLKVPSVAPFTALGDYRVEFRIHDWVLPSGGSVAYVSWGSVYSGVRYLEITFSSSGAICAVDWVDSLSRGNASCADLTGHRDVVLRVQRFGSNYAPEDGAVGSFVLDAQDIDGTPMQSYCYLPGMNYACPILSAGRKDWSGIAGFVGNPSQATSFSLSWLKWFSATVPPGSPFSMESTPADLADWRFEGNPNNEGTGGYKVSIGSFAGSPTYGASRSYPPTCNAGAQQVFRAGYAAQLDGTNAYPLNGNPQLTYLWQEISGPTQVSWTGQNTAAPTVRQTIFGSYVFQLTVKDSAGQSGTCTVKHGFVATDDNGIVITNNGTVDTLLGSMIRYGANPWPWFDDRHKAGADLVIASLGTALNSSKNYADFWRNTKGPGTITVTGGSTIVTGSGTTFTTTFCQGPQYPNAPTSGGSYPTNIALAIDATNSRMVRSPSYSFVPVNVQAWIYVSSGIGWAIGLYQIQSVSNGAAVLDRSPSAAGNMNTAIFSLNSLGTMVLVWYPDASQEGYGLRGVTVSSCQSDTQLTLGAPWERDVADCHNGGCSYSYDDGWIDATGGAIWTYPAGEGSNYYDDVAGLYALYYRSGLDDYLTAARTLADRFWKYRLGSGTLCNSSPGPNQCGGNNAPREQSLIGMVLRATDGRPDMWPGLENLFTYYMMFLNNIDLVWGLWDIREEAYHMAMISYCGMFDPNQTFRSNCKSALSTAMNGLWNVTQSPDGTWQQLYTSADSWEGGTTSVSLTHGSTQVTGNGTAWNSGEFTPNMHIVFLPTSAAPANIQAQERTCYTPKFVDGTHLTLDRPYEGTTGTHGWMLGYGAAAPNVVTGWGGQPFINGILGLAFEFTAKALGDTDPANARRAHNYNLSIARWEMNVGYRPEMKGMEYIAGSVECPPPIPESATWCTGNSTASQARTLSAESLRSVMLAYADSTDSGLLAFGDTLYNAMYAKAGYCSAVWPICVPDGQYVTDFNSGLGWYMSGDPVNDKWHKYFGMLFGIGAGSDWPAYRIGGARTRKGRLIRVAFNMVSVPGVASVRVTTIAPDGEVVETPCASSPCTVTIDERQGDHIFQLEYLAADGAVLASTALPTAEGH